MQSGGFDFAASWGAATSDAGVQPAQTTGGFSAPKAQGGGQDELKVDDSSVKQFIPCDRFKGNQEGYEFRNGDNGVGYYREVKTEVAKVSVFKPQSTDDFYNTQTDKDFENSQVTPDTPMDSYGGGAAGDMDWDWINKAPGAAEAE